MGGVLHKERYVMLIQVGHMSYKGQEEVVESMCMY